MYCSNCKNVEQYEGKFCVRCGGQLEKNVPVDSTKTVTLRFSNATKVKDHLEFLGYKVEIATAIDNKASDALLAASDKNSNILVLVNDELEMLSARYNTNIGKKADSLELFQVLNGVNSNAVFSRWVVKNEKDRVLIVIECQMFGYEKIGFGKMIDVFESEIRQNIGKFSELEDDRV